MGALAAVRSTDTRRRERDLSLRIALAATTVLAALVVATPARAVDLPGGRVTLGFSDRIVDTRDGTGVPAGLATTVPLPVNVVLTLTVMAESLTGRGFVLPCGATPYNPKPGELPPPSPPVTPAVVFFRAREIVSNTVITGPSPSCLITTTPVDITVDHRGDITAAPGTGSQYEPLAERVVINSNGSLSGEVTVTLGSSQPPIDATAAVVRVTVDAASTSGGFVTFHKCGQAFPPHSDVVASTTTTADTLVYAPLTSPGAGNFCFYSQSPVTVTLAIFGYLRASGPDPTRLPPQRVHNYRTDYDGLIAGNPVRVLDTREIGAGGLGRKAGADEVIVVDLTSRVSYQARAAVLNVTVTEPEAVGYVTVYPCDRSRPTASNLNYIAGQTVPNLVNVRVPSDGRVCIYTKAKAHLVADLSGNYSFARGPGAMPVAPGRLLDTRETIGGKLAADSVLTLQVAGRTAVPAAGVDSVTMNVTVTDPTAAGYLTVYPCDRERPTASNLNYEVGQTVPNAVTAVLSATGTVCIYTKSPTHVVADLSVWYGGNETIGYRPLDPDRLLDTREAIGVPAAGKADAGSVLTLAVTGRGGVPSTGVSAVVLNVTVTEPEGPGYVTAYPCDTAQPTASNVNYVAGQTVPNLVTVKVSAQGTVCLFSQRKTHLVADVAGFLSPDLTFDWVPDVQ